MAMAAMEAVRRCVARRGGSQRRGGGSEHAERARGRRWLRQRRTAATNALGHERESEGEERRGLGRVRGLGGAGVVGCLQRRAGKQEVAGMCSRAATTHPSSSWQEEEDDRGGGDGPGWLASCVGFSPGPGKLGEVFPFLLFFSIF